MSVIVKGDSPFDAFIVSGIKDCHTEHIKFYNISFNCKTIEDADGRVFTRREERKTGRWIQHLEQKNIYGGKCVECSECGERYLVQYIEDEKFCRHCGAKMEGTE